MRFGWGRRGVLMLLGSSGVVQRKDDIWGWLGTDCNEQGKLNASYL
jgi:hypothetical protein